MNGGNQFVKKKPKVKGKPVDKFDKYEPRPYAEWVKTREKVFTNIDKTFATCNRSYKGLCAPRSACQLRFAPTGSLLNPAQSLLMMFWGGWRKSTSSM